MYRFRPSTDLSIQALIPLSFGMYLPRYIRSHCILQWLSMLLDMLIGFCLMNRWVLYLKKQNLRFSFSLLLICYRTHLNSKLAHQTIRNNLLAIHGFSPHHQKLFLLHFLQYISFRFEVALYLQLHWLHVQHNLLTHLPLILKFHRL